MPAITITIATTTGPREVSATPATRYFAVHHAPDDGDHVPGIRDWTVTHRRTGYGAGHATTKAGAVRLARELAAAGDWTFTSPADISPATKSHAKAVLAAHRARTGGRSAPAPRSIPRGRKPRSLRDRCVDLACRLAEEDNYGGVCLACGAEAYGCEPDARQYPCGACGERAVYGAEEAILMDGRLS